jgi:hypothetical protein
MNYRSVFLATTILIGEKSSTSCLIARHLLIWMKSHVIANKEYTHDGRHARREPIISLSANRAFFFLFRQPPVILLYNPVTAMFSTQSNNDHPFSIRSIFQAFKLMP